VGIDYSVLSFGIHNLVEGGNIGDYYMNSELFEKYTSPESLIQSDDRSIVLKAQSLTRDVENSHEKISRIFEHVVSHIHYVSQDYERGALWALENGTGDCSEYSYLFVALCRAAGIPARVKTGFAFHYDNEKLEEGHMWAEYYLEGYGWVQVDPAWNIFDGIDERHFDSLQGTPEYIPYANYFFNYTVRPDEVAVKDSETIQIRSFSAISFNGSLASNVIQAVQTINQGEQAVFIEKLLGMPMLFSAEAQDAEHALFESRIHLQDALGNWEADPKAVQSAILESISDGEVTVHTALALVGYAFIISISVLLAVLLAALFLMKRQHLKPEHYSSETKASYD
jgi:hypothetical protein